tara:strand:- start:1969 stop:2355 length:387 start_codon:yes stop_codon:yes gene_type:complete
MTIKTLNFNPDTDPKLLCTCGHPDCDQRSVSQAVLDMTQSGRDILRHGVRVTSGGRCPNHQSESHRTTPADHQKGNGIDVSVNGSTRGNVVSAGIEVGFNAIGVAKTFVHWGYRKELPVGHITMWVYS